MLSLLQVVGRIHKTSYCGGGGGGFGYILDKGHHELLQRKIFTTVIRYLSPSFHCNT